MTRRCLVAVQGPLQLCTAFIAMEWYGLKNFGTPDANAVLLIYDFLVSPEQEKPILEAIMQLTAIRKWEKIIFINSFEMDQITNLDFNSSILEIRKRIGENFDEVYLARNYIGLGSALIFEAYSRAKHITYGDGFGLVGEASASDIFGATGAEHFYNRLRTLILKPGTFAIKAISFFYQKSYELIKAIRYGKQPPLREFDAAVLILPIDYSGTYLNKLPLYVPAREYVVNIIEKFNSLLPALNEYCLNLIRNIKGECYLYLFITPSESGVTSREKEVDLYIDTIHEHSPPGSTIFIKLHPRKNISFADFLLPLLEHDYNVCIVNKENFKSIPIEFWTPLIERCKIISFSSSMLSLKYIYDKDVISGFSLERIRKYFFRKSWKYWEDEFYMWQEILSALKNWSGNSPLWTRSTSEKVQ